MTKNIHRLTFSVQTIKYSMALFPMAFLKALKNLNNQGIIELRHIEQELATDLLITKFKKTKQTERMVGTEGGELGRKGIGNRPGRKFLL